MYLKTQKNLGAPLAERLRALFLNHSIIPSLCQTSQVQFAGVPGVFFLGVLPVSPHLTSSLSCLPIRRNVDLYKKRH